MTDDELREQLALLAVGALDDDERDELETALRRRPDLQAELEELRDAAAVLADAATSTPPPRLRASVLEAAAATPQLPAGEATPDPSRPAIAPVVPLRAGRRSIGLAAAAAIVAVMAGILVAAPWDDAGEDPVAAVLEADDAVEISMAGTGAPGSLPDLAIVHSSSADAAVLVADDVPIPAGDRVYELWAIRDGAPERFAVFRPDDEGRLNVYVPDLDPAAAEMWAITEEPAGGSETPTGPVLNATA